jgi:hypothetical protein
MLIDKENLLSYQQAITVTADSTNIIDLGPHHWGGAAGDDKEIPMFMNVDETFTAAGAGTLTIEIRSSPVSNFASGVKTHLITDAIAKGNLEIGDKQRQSLSLPADVQRYVKAVYTVGTGPFTAGKLTLGVTASRQTNL